MKKNVIETESNFQDRKIAGNLRKRQRLFYNGVSSEYREAYLDSLIGDVRNIKILDLGAGNGWFTSKMLHKGGNVYAIDISPKSIEKITGESAEYKAKGMYSGFVMDATNMSFANNTFDIVVGHGILHHLLDYENTIMEILRVLKPGGCAYFYEPLGMNPLVNLYRLLTPKARTKNERPLSKADIELIKGLNPSVKFSYFEMLSLLSKPFSILGMTSTANKVENSMLEIDKKLLAKETSKPSFFQRMSWIVLIQLKK